MLDPDRLRVCLTVFVLLSGQTVRAASGGTALVDPGAAQGKHFDPKGKLPSKFTAELQQRWRKSLPFEDQRDFEEAKRGFIAAPSYKTIKADDGHIVWDMESYEWLLQKREWDSIHPSLQRQAILNMAYGLYEVLPGRIWQVRGFDLANISFIKGDTGWIVFDPLTSKETAKAALDFVTEKLGKRPVIAVVYSHSHGDHFGGVRGVVDEGDVRAGKVKIIAPVGFLRHAVSENVFAGNAMSRRLFYQYGVLLPRSPFGHVDQSIGKNVSAGNAGLIAPTVTIEKPLEEITVDGVQMVFQNTPGTEAPAEMNTYFPQLKIFWAAENITGTIHNIYTLRGAQVRDPLAWSKYINEALYRFGQEAEVMFASHSWPRFGNARVQEVMRIQRDVYAHLNNDVLHKANQGVTVNEIQNVYRLPKSLEQSWAAHSYHGSEEHNSRGVINRYLGYWDANPATLTPLSPRESAPLYVEMMGGSKKILARSRKLISQGRYLYAVELLNKLVFAEPKNQTAKDLLADAYEQIGYQKESPSVRNSFLNGAYELRHGIPTGVSPVAGADTIRAMSTGLFLDFLGIKLDGDKVGDAHYVVNLVTPDNGEKYVVELSHGTLTNIQGFLAQKPDLTMTINRADLEQVMMGSRTLEQQISSGKATLAGDGRALQVIGSAMTNFAIGFEILPGTAAKPAAADQTRTSFQADAPLTEGG